MNITLLNINHSTLTAKNGKPYQVAEVAFKNNTFQGKVESFKVTSYMKGFPAVASSSVGDTLDVVVEKSAAGFNQWEAVTKAAPGASTFSPPTTPAPAGATAVKNTVNTYGKDFETREERAKKQVYIVRQSSASNAVNMLLAGAKAPPKIDDVISLAKELEAYVFASDVQDLDAVENDPQLD